MQEPEFGASNRKAPSNRAARWAAALMLLAAAAGLVVHTARNVFSQIDITLHYALVARISENWDLPDGYDPSLEELSFYPNASHRLAALTGKVTGSPLTGMQHVAMAALAALWAGLGLVYLSLHGGVRWLALGALLVLLILNRALIRLELFGNEVIVNYFFPQLVAQSIAVILLAAALWIERLGAWSGLRYLMLGAFAPIMPMFHLIPGAEVLAVLGLLTVVDALEKSYADRLRRLYFGIAVSVMALVVTVLSPAFQTMIRLSSNEGHLQLRYTPTMYMLATEAVIVLGVSAVLVVRWLRWRTPETRMGALAAKYLGVFGLAAGGLCLIQIGALQLGYGSEYACKKYAFALNTLVLLDLPVLFAIRESWIRLWQHRAAPPFKIDSALRGAAYVPVFMVAAILIILPPASSSRVRIPDFELAERFAMEHRQRIPGEEAGKYDLAMDFVGANRAFDTMITIGVLRAPRSGNAEDFQVRGVIGKPSRLGRIFTRAGVEPWDVSDCRLLVSTEGFVILDGKCVLSALGG